MIAILYRDREGAYDTHSLRARHGHDTTGVRLRHDHDTAGHRRDTAERGAMTRRPARAVRSLSSGCAPNLVLTQCTVLSHCLGYCS